MKAQCSNSRGCELREMQRGSQPLLTFMFQDFREEEHESSMLQPVRLQVEKSVKEKSRRNLDCPSRETCGEWSEFRESFEILWTVGSTLSRTVDLLHESPYRNSEICMK
jgi:hypothetical protein